MERVEGYNKDGNVAAVVLGNNLCSRLVARRGLNVEQDY